MRTTRLAAAAIAALIVSASAAFAADEYNTSKGLTAAGHPLGMHGVDPVAFLTLGNRIDGRARHTVTHDGVDYYFSSEETLKSFQANPAAFLPENGGFCTFGVSVGKKFDGNPKFAAVVDDKLYLFLNEEIFRLFQKDKAGTIAKAAANWSKIRSVPAGEL
ncbi:YHS domain-containing (seleno)protein [Nisaea sediminum]|uniref:YHS domain-containing (seleno)protein n=1 Tax=Nisaea sediminum TaxID=2775867 RepID=UPI0018696505|nr:YHS domain-containing (seleno)protein [Nisaea sediminum]